MRCSPLIAAVIVLACSSGDTTEPPLGETTGRTAFEIAYAEIAGEDLGTGSIYVTTDGTRGRLLVDVPNGPDFPSDWSPDRGTLLALARRGRWLGTAQAHAGYRERCRRRVLDSRRIPYRVRAPRRTGSGV